MKFLILSTATGQGHNSAAAALKESLEQLDCEAVVKDVLKSGKTKASDRVSSLYTNMTLHFPHFFGLLYHAGEVVSSSRRHSPIYYLNTLYEGSLLRQINTLHPDCIVCTHIFSAQAVTRLYEKHRINIPTAGIITDYTCSPFWEETRLDSYIIPVEALTDEFVKKGIPEEKLVPLGIPVRKCFYEAIPKKQARMLLHLNCDRLFVIAGGSMGYGHIRKLALTLSGQMPDAQTVVLCGYNEKLYRELEGIKNIMPYRYTDKISVFMDAADVLLTKPGGLTSSEALVKNVPMVLTGPIPGGEERNAAFLSSLGVAVSAREANTAAREAERLMVNPYAVQKMLEKQKQHFGCLKRGLLAEYLVDMVKARLG